MGVTVDKIREFEEKRDDLLTMGGEKNVQKQHDRGKLTARERIDLLFDKNTFQETQLFVKHRSTLFGMDK
ncbi:MAG: methylmalonyl-CoA carboxyltransferase, partial [Deltaproteobacteria bacterium]|nr:methylmalonyl-CoA carboxyltransferase [Deltaproteobacteria bacterium]